ncbi:hypothetical protein FWC31_01585 [Candidatus Saccharibacteria bacterium]|nr:hypothetical protein [Candidatus Saccharibacteria bacterium]
MKIQKKKTMPKPALVALLVVTFVLIAGATCWCLRENGFFDRSNDQTNQHGDQGNDTPGENTNDDDKKFEEESPTKTDEDGKKVAQITIVYADQDGDMFEVRAGVYNITEETGWCEFVFTNQNGLTLTRTSTAIFTGTGTDCTPIDIPIRDFPVKGEWQMVVKYTSPTAAGASEIKTVVLR